MTHPAAFPNPTNDTSRTDFEDMALVTADRLVRDAIWHGDRCAWAGDAMEMVDDAWKVVWRSTNVGYYEGNAGIALFLARAARLSQDGPTIDTARAAMTQTMAGTERYPDASGWGFYAGFGGIAYAAREVAEAIDAPEFQRFANDIVRRMVDIEPTDTSCDVMVGPGGGIPFLLYWHRKTGDDAALDLANREADWLIARASRHALGLSWETLPGRPAGSAHLAGYSHGVAGIALALLELAAVTGRQDLRETADAAIAYEQTVFQPEMANWPDLRQCTFDDLAAKRNLAAPTYWCHGAAGIAVARARTYRLTGDQAMLDQARIALETTRRHCERSMANTDPNAAFERNMSLCHGIGGNADILMLGGTLLGDANLVAWAHHVGRWGLDHLRRSPGAWPCGVAGGGETPGLMLGIAGIGHLYLRLADPSIPSPLLIESGA